MKVIVRIRGGLGNQLFCYCAARRLALANKAELIIDDVTGFARDSGYCRRFMLDRFSIPARKATPTERLEPFERYRRALMKWLARRRPFAERHYLEQEGVDFDERLLAFRVNGVLYMDGLWQGEGYFKDVEQTIRNDLRIYPPEDAMNRQIADEIRSSNSVALHVRWFDGPGGVSPYNISADYYRRAIALLDETIASPRYFLFSDEPEAARAKLALPKERVTCVTHNRGDEAACADLWLMAQCRHFIIANSTFSWWGAWLSACTDKLVVTPILKIDGVVAWGFKGLIPDGWVQV